MHNFIIKRSKWYRGKGGDSSRLLNRKGQQCCVGMICSQMGIPDKIIENQEDIHSMLERKQLTIPEELVKKLKEVFRRKKDSVKLYGTFEDQWVRNAYVINDAPDLSDYEREKKLKELAAKNDVELTFVD